MPKNKLKNPATFRRKREFIIIATIIIVVILLTVAELKILYFGTDFPISNTILMFILINVNLLLLLFLIFLVFRNIVKLLYDRKRKVMGSRLRAKLSIAFIIFSLVPTTVLFLFSISFITTSTEFWFNTPVEQALSNSLAVGRRLYNYVEESNRFYLERIAYQIKTRILFKYYKHSTLSNYIQVAQKSFNLDAVEVYDVNFNRIVFFTTPKLKEKSFDVLKINSFKKKTWNNNIITALQKNKHGEFIKSICTVPFGVTYEKADAFVVLTVVISPDLSEKLASISRGFEEYQQIKLLKKPIQSAYYIILSIVALLVIFCAVWFGFYIAKSISIPIKELAEGTRRVAEGNLNFKIDIVADEEIGSLVDSFNKMTKDLLFGREQLELTTNKLREQNVEIEERRQYMEIVLKDISAGVISINTSGFVTTINTSAEKMLNVKPKDILFKSYKRLLKGNYLKLGKDVMKKISIDPKGSYEFPLRLTILDSPKSFMVRVNSLKDDKGTYMGAVVVFDDLTELEKAERMAAWREVARRIAHEVKNPLTPITLSAQRLKRKYSQDIKDPVFENCTKTIIEYVALIRDLVNEFSTFARFPAAKLSPCELPQIIEETLSLYKEVRPEISFDFKLLKDIPIINIDKQQMKQVMINLMDNAIASIDKQGSVSITLTHNAVSNIVRIEVADTGKGILDDEKTNLFEPYFSTKKTGMGLGLAIVNSIITDHKGIISVYDNQPKGAKFIIELPV